MPQTDNLGTTRPSKILVAEDEELILRVFEAILKKSGYEVICAENGALAASFFDAAPDSFDLLITDLTLPELSGEALAAHVRKARPEMKIIFSTGHITQAPKQALDKFRGSMFLPKPFGMEDLNRAVSKALQS